MSKPAAYYVLPGSKLLALDLATLGIYKLVWFYRNWQVQEEREQKPLLPLLRALLAGVFCYGFFRYVEDDARTLGLSMLLRPWLLTLGLWLCSLAGWFDERLALLGLLGVLPILYVNNLLHRINWQRDAEFVPETAYTPLQLFWLSFGVVWWMLVLQAMFGGTSA